MKTHTWVSVINLTWFHSACFDKAGCGNSPLNWSSWTTWSCEYPTYSTTQPRSRPQFWLFISSLKPTIGPNIRLGNGRCTMDMGSGAAREQGARVTPGYIWKLSQTFLGRYTNIDCNLGNQPKNCICPFNLEYFFNFFKTVCRFQYITLLAPNIFIWFVSYSVGFQKRWYSHTCWT